MADARQPVSADLRDRITTVLIDAGYTCFRVGRFNGEGNLVRTHPELEEGERLLLLAGYAIPLRANNLTVVQRDAELYVTQTRDNN